MKRTDLAKGLEQLAESSTRSKSARLLDLMPEIEAAMNKGITHAKIVKQLNDSGFEISIKTFQVSLTRIRKRQKTNRPQNNQNQTRQFPQNKPQQQIEVESSKEPELPETTPAKLDSLIRKTPDLSALAKIGRNRK